MIELRHFEKSDPTMHALVRNWQQSGALAPSKVDSKKYVHSLYSSIISQQISTKAAAKIKQRFFELLDKNYKPEDILDLDIEQLRAVGLSRQKASYIHSIATHTLEGTVDFDNLDALSDQKVIDELTKIKGVGVWTAEMFLIFTLARPNVFSEGDLGLQNALQLHYKSVDTITKKQKIIESWAPYKSIASLALWHSLDNKPK